MLVLLDTIVQPAYVSGYVNHLPIFLEIPVAAAGSVLGALTKCSLWERLWLIFRVCLQQGESAPGSRVDGEQGLISSRQFCIFDGSLGASSLWAARVAR